MVSWAHGEVGPAAVRGAVSPWARRPPRGAVSVCTQPAGASWGAVPREGGAGRPRGQAPPRSCQRSHQSAQTAAASGHAAPDSPRHGEPSGREGRHWLDTAESTGPALSTAQLEACTSLCPALCGLRSSPGIVSGTKRPPGSPAASTQGACLPGEGASREEGSSCLCEAGPPRHRLSSPPQIWTRAISVAIWGSVVLRGVWASFSCAICQR